MQNLESSAVIPYQPDIITPMPALQDLILSGSPADNEKAFAHCMKILEGMMKIPKTDSERSVSMLLGRKQDPKLGMPASALYEMLPVIFNDPLMAMRFLRMYSIFHNSPFTYNVSIKPDELVKDVSYFQPLACVAFKLYEPSDWFRELPQEERYLRILQKGVVKQTLAEVMEPLLSAMEKCDQKPKIIVWGPNPNSNYKGYDALRAAFVERKVFDQLRKLYGNHPQIELREDKHIRNAVQLLTERYAKH